MVTLGQALRGLQLTLQDRQEAVRNPLLLTVWPSVKQGQWFCDAVTGPRRYFNFIRAALDQPSPTIPRMLVVFHPTEPRLLAIRELRRLCSFPDDWKDGTDHATCDSSRCTQGAAPVTRRVRPR